MAPPSQRPDDVEPAPWYSEGLRFECQPDCGACCTDHGDCQYVYVSPTEVTAIAEYLGIDGPTVLRRYTEPIDGLRVLKTDRPDCPFLVQKRCSIYPARPGQCRTFPFWGENLENPERWKGLCEFCPGVGKGPVRGLEVIDETLRAHRETE